MYTKCWLDYRKKDNFDNAAGEGVLNIQCGISGPIIKNAIKELKLGLHTMFGRASVGNIYLDVDTSIREGGFRIIAKNGECIIEGGDPGGILYGVFHVLRLVRMNDALADFKDFTCDLFLEPDNPLRILNHWDNMDGSIERGYSGKSFFFCNDEVLVNERTADYARLVSSIGINAVVINNVNVRGAATELITPRYYHRLKELGEVFNSYGIVLYISINYASPMELGGLGTADPCDGDVASWWNDKAREIWENVPSLGGFLIKADSEGRPGPFTYGRNHAEGANMLANAVRPYGGRIIWRCFVYNCTQDWRDTVTDRARACYDNFMPLDGSFEDNVILQIKNGPMDFQVREPVSPLFGALKKTNMLLEVQIAQEYTGQQRHVCYLVPWFKEILAFNMKCGEGGTKVSDGGVATRVSDIISGRAYGRTNCGMTAVANTGDDANWTGHDFAAANLYGFGRLAYDMSLSAEEIAKEWILLTYGNNQNIMNNFTKILMSSWPTYEKYTAPLGIGWMVNPGSHYGPNVDGYEYDRWGTYHRADCKGIGIDRTSAGTGYCGQYGKEVADMYANTGTCPDELLLFFHHVPYTHVLKSGKTVIQHIYDTHFEGADEAKGFEDLVNEVREELPEDVYERIIRRFVHQSEHAAEWRDRINTYFYRMSGIRDKKDREIW